MKNIKRLAIAREVIDLLEYKQEKGLNALVLYMLIKMNYEMACEWCSIKNEWKISLDKISSVSHLKLSKEDKSKMIEALEYLSELGVITIEDMPKGYAKEFTIICNASMLDKTDSYVLARVDELQIILEDKLSVSRVDLAVYLFFVSVCNGKYIHQSLEDVASRLTNKDYADSEDPSAWLIRLTKEECDKIQELICWYNLEDICMLQHSMDKKGETWTTRPTLTKSINRLEEKQILGATTTLCKGFANKKVICKFEHLELVKAYYDRKDSQAQHEWGIEQQKAKEEIKTIKKQTFNQSKNEQSQVKNSAPRNRFKKRQ